MFNPHPQTSHLADCKGEISKCVCNEYCYVDAMTAIATVSASTANASASAFTLAANKKMQALQTKKDAIVMIQATSWCHGKSRKCSYSSCNTMVTLKSKCIRIPWTTGGGWFGAFCSVSCLYLNFEKQIRTLQNTPGAHHERLVINLQKQRKLAQKFFPHSVPAAKAKPAIAKPVVVKNGTVKASVVKKEVFSDNDDDVPLSKRTSLAQKRN